MQLEDEGEGAPDEAVKVYQFLLQATSPSVALFPEGVEEWVANHKHDIMREERWRTQLGQDIAGVAAAVRQLLTGEAASAKKLEQRMERQEAALTKIAAALADQQLGEKEMGGPRSESPFISA